MSWATWARGAAVRAASGPATPPDTCQPFAHGHIAGRRPPPARPVDARYRHVQGYPSRPQTLEAVTIIPSTPVAPAQLHYRATGLSLSPLLEQEFIIRSILLISKLTAVKASGPGSNQAYEILIYIPM